jgi:hypothetical protein
MEDVARSTANPFRGHESRDADIRRIMWFALSLITTICVVLLLMAWTLRALSPPQSAVAPPAGSLDPAKLIPTEPRLQVDAPRDLRTMRKHEDAVLNSYDWIDKQRGIVRIPVDRAIELLVQRGESPPAKEPGEAREK